MIRWMIEEGHLDEDDNPTIGLKSGKAKASRESGGFVPWTEEDMALFRAKWPLGTEARLAGTSGENRVVTLRSNLHKKA